MPRFTAGEAKPGLKEKYESQDSKGEAELSCPVTFSNEAITSEQKKGKPPAIVPSTVM